MKSTLLGVKTWTTANRNRFIQKLCEDAQARAPAIIFLDEIDGLLCNGASGSQGYELKLLSCFKSWLSRLQQARAQVLVIATSNYPWRLHRIQGLPRRFPTQLHIGLPEDAHRRDLFKSILRKLQVFNNIGDDMSDLVKASRGMTGHDIRYAIVSARKLKRLECMDEQYFIPVCMAQTSMCYS